MVCSGQKYSIQYLKEGFIFGLKGHMSNVLSFVNYRIDMFLIAILLMMWQLEYILLQSCWSSEFG